MKVDPIIALATKDCLANLRSGNRPNVKYSTDGQYVYLAPNGHYAVQLLPDQVEINLTRCTKLPFLLDLPWDTTARNLLSVTSTTIEIMGEPATPLKGPDYLVYIDARYKKPLNGPFWGSGPKKPVTALSRDGISTVIMPMIGPQREDDN
jgi:hypothetical protein